MARKNQQTFEIVDPVVEDQEPETVVVETPLPEVQPEPQVVTRNAQYVAVTPATTPIAVQPDGHKVWCEGYHGEFGQIAPGFRVRQDPQGFYHADRLGEDGEWYPLVGKNGQELASARAVHVGWVTRRLADQAGIAYTSDRPQKPVAPKPEKPVRLSKKAIARAALDRLSVFLVENQANLEVTQALGTLAEYAGLIETA